MHIDWLIGYNTASGMSCCNMDFDTFYKAFKKVVTIPQAVWAVATGENIMTNTFEKAKLQYRKRYELLQLGFFVSPPAGQTIFVTIPQAVWAVATWLGVLKVFLILLLQYRKRYELLQHPQKKRKRTTLVTIPQAVWAVATHIDWLIGICQ